MGKQCVGLSGIGLDHCPLNEAGFLLEPSHRQQKARAWADHDKVVRMPSPAACCSTIQPSLTPASPLLRTEYMAYYGVYGRLYSIERGTYIYKAPQPFIAAFRASTSPSAARRSCGKLPRMCRFGRATRALFSSQRRRCAGLASASIYGLLSGLVYIARGTATKHIIFQSSY